MPTQLLVAGFHRSGTSLLSQLLHESGLFLGNELLGAMPSNPYGHYEDVEVIDIHESILAANGESWHVTGPRAFHLGEGHWEAMRELIGRRDAEHDLWGFKDPRACLFLGAWKYLAPEARFVVVYRDPAECVWSLERRQSEDLFDGRGPRERHLRFWTEPDHGIRLWVAYSRALLNFVRAHADHCLLVPFTLLQDGYPIVREVNRRFGTDLLETPTPAVFDAGATSRRPGPQPIVSSHLAETVGELWAEYETLADTHGPR